MAELYGQRVQSTVQTSYIPYAVDIVLNSNVLLQRIVRAGKKWSGRTLRVPIKVSKNTTGQSFRGFDTFSVAATDNRQVMEFTPTFYQITCALPGDELSVADTEEKVLDMMKLTIQSDTEDMADDLGTIFYANGNGNNGKDPSGLDEIVDDGSNAATYGGLTRANVGDGAVLDSTVTASGGTLTLALIDTLWNNVTSGSQKPTIGYTTEAVYSFYGQLLRPQERINKDASLMKGLVGGTGFTGLDYMGKSIVADEKATSGALFFLNENFLEWYALPFFNAKPIQYKSQVKGNDYSAPVGLGFAWSDWIIPANAGAVVGHIYFGGQFITTNPKRHGRLNGITGI